MRSQDRDNVLVCNEDRGGLYLDRHRYGPRRDVDGLHDHHACSHNFYGTFGPAEMGNFGADFLLVEGYHIGDYGPDYPYNDHSLLQLVLLRTASQLTSVSD